MGVLFGYLAFLVVAGFLIVIKGRDIIIPAIAILIFLLVFGLYMAHFGTDRNDLIIGALLGVFIAAISGKILRLGVFLCGFLYGLSVGSLIYPLIPYHFQYDRAVYTAVTAVIVGILLVKAVDVAITVVTAGAGSLLVAFPCVYMIMNPSRLGDCIGPDNWTTIQNVNHNVFGEAFHANAIILIACLLITLFGVVMQMRNCTRSFSKGNKR